MVPRCRHKHIWPGEAVCYPFATPYGHTTHPGSTFCVHIVNHVHVSFSKPNRERLERIYLPEVPKLDLFGDHSTEYEAAMRKIDGLMLRQMKPCVVHWQCGNTAGDRGAGFMKAVHFVADPADAYVGRRKKLDECERCFAKGLPAWLRRRSLVRV